MNIFQIKAEIQRITDGYTDPETGEITFDAAAALEQLDMEKGEKIKHVTHAYKNYDAENTALEAEIKKMQDRVAKNKKRMENCKNYLDAALEGEEWKDTTFMLKYRNSNTTEVDEDFVKWAYRYRKDLLRQKPKPEPEPDKTAIAKAIKNGERIKHAWISTHRNLNIS